jgi:hypothetical protein
MPDGAGLPGCHGLDNHYANFVGAQGQMSQRGCGNFWGAANPKSLYPQRPLRDRDGRKGSLAIQDLLGETVEQIAVARHRLMTFVLLLA